VKAVLLPLAEPAMSNATLTIWLNPIYALVASDATNGKRSTIDRCKIDCDSRPSGFGSNVRFGCAP